MNSLILSLMKNGAVLFFYLKGLTLVSNIKI